MVDLEGVNLGEVFSTAFSIVGTIFVVLTLILFGWVLIWKMFLIRFSFIRELVYGSEEGSSDKTNENQATSPDTPLRRSSRLRERQSKNQHGEL